MKRNFGKSSIVRSANISNQTLKELKRQLLSLPKFWKMRFISDEWQMIITDDLPKEIGSEFTQYYIDPANKEIWLNVSIITMQKNLIFKGIANYVSMEYGNVSQYKTFINLFSKEEKQIKRFMNFRGNFFYTHLDVFVELFAYVIETNGVNTNCEINNIYQYIKKWVNGQIFDLRFYSIPQYLNVGEYIIVDQIELVAEAYENVPQKLKKKFYEDGWRIQLSNKKLLDSITSGVCSSMHKSIFVKGSSINMKHTIYHEFGHYLDFKENIISNTVSFMKIFIQERKKFYKVCENDFEYEYSISSCEEYFAEIFAYYFEKNFELQKVVPNSYMFIHRLVSKWMK